MQNITCSGHHLSPSEYFMVDQTSSCRITSYHTPTCPQVFHRGLFVTPLEKGIPESQQSLAKGKATVLKSCTCSAKSKWLSAQPTRHPSPSHQPLTASFSTIFMANHLEVTTMETLVQPGHTLGTPLSATTSGRGQGTQSWPANHHWRFSSGVKDLVILDNGGRFPERLQDSWQNVFRDFGVTASCRETSSGEVQMHLARGLGQNKLAEPGEPGKHYLCDPLGAANWKTENSHHRAKDCYWGFFNH